MPITVENRQGVCTLRVEGDMTIYGAAELKGQLLAPLTECAELEVNLAEVGDMDTAGIQLLLLLKREAQRAGKSLRLVEHSRAVREVLELYNLAGHFGDPVVIPAGRD